MNPVATYSFLPWLRHGVANTITSPDGDATVKARASIHVDLTLSGDPVGGGAELTQDIPQDVALYGPGDIVGIDSRAVFRTEPRNWITNFEPNYLAAVEFYDQDFSWRYTPAAPDTPDGAGGPNLHLRPWIALVVLKETEFTEGQNVAGRPAPYITVTDSTLFPPTGELWAWAHVHFNQGLSTDSTELVSKDMGAVLPRIEAAVAANPDIAYSRLLCPRQLEANTGYHAFVVPVFETGRLAGLGKDPTQAPYATHGAWTPYPSGTADEPTNFPFYYRWYFRTGSLGDFEYLVGLLKSQSIDPTVGVRDMDVQAPGSGLPGITDAALGGVLRLGGALRVPDADLTPAQLNERHKYDQWDQPYPHAFEKSLASFINLADDYATEDPTTANANTDLGPEASADPDPLITPPLYGRWQALTQRLLADPGGNPVANPTNWVHRLNLDPLYRVPAGFGANVVERNAESYMNAAWEQIGDVLAANQRIRRLHLALAVSSRWYVNHLTPLSTANSERAYALAAPIARRVLVAGRTIAYSQSASLLSTAMTSTVLRRVVRPSSRLMKSLPVDPSATPKNLLARVNAGDVSAAPPKTVPPAVPTIGQAAGAAATASGAPSWIATLLANSPWLPLAVLVLSILIAIALAILVPGIGWVLALAVVGFGGYLYSKLKSWAVTGTVVAILNPVQQTPAAVDTLPLSPDFVLMTPGFTVTPTIGTSDSPTAVNFKAGLRDSFALRQTSLSAGFQAPRGPVDLGGFTTATITALDPQQTILQRGFTTIQLPGWVRPVGITMYDEVMAYPKIDVPLYRPLKDISIELFLPHINLIASNSITLIETNRKFIEAYMVGANYEFARKLLWREYPTDQRGSYFRQFWDPAPAFPPKPAEALYDILPIHEWPLDSDLGQHANPPKSAGAPEDVVLVIRGELLKKYPTAVIFAQKAVWDTTDGVKDPTLPRKLEDVTDAELQNPVPDKLRMPLYEAKVDPDIYFFGFDLTVNDALGGSGPDDNPGWFFVIKERPGEPRFGLEVSRATDPEIFDELTWSDALGAAGGAFLPAGALSNVTLAPVPLLDDEGKQVQQNDDEKVNVAAVSSARWAYLLLRAPVMVAVHAAQMLGSS